MALQDDEEEKTREISPAKPNVTIFLQPVAPPAAMGLAGFAGATFVVASWIAGWWGKPDSPVLFFPFVAFWGGLAQFIAGIKGYAARDTLVTVVNTMWGSFWMSMGLLWAFVATGAIPGHGIHEHYPELAAWFVPLSLTTWSAAIAATNRDAILATLLFSLAIGSTIACCLFAYGTGAGVGIRVAAYFWLLSALLAWWRVTVYLIEEAFGATGLMAKYFTVFRAEAEKREPPVMSGFGEPGVKRGAPGVIGKGFSS